MYISNGEGLSSGEYTWGEPVACEDMRIGEEKEVEGGKEVIESEEKEVRKGKGLKRVDVDVWRNGVSQADASEDVEGEVESKSRPYYFPVCADILNSRRQE